MSKHTFTLSCEKCRWEKECHPLVIDGIMLTDFGKMQCMECMSILTCEAKNENPIDNELEDAARKVTSLLNGGRYKAEGALGTLHAVVNDSIG